MSSLQSADRAFEIGGCHLPIAPLTPPHRRNTRVKTLLTTSAVALILLAVTLCGCGSSERNVINNKGSDTLVNVAQAWAEAYNKVDPNVAIAVSGGGSGTGVSSLINGTVQIANSSRAMKSEEIESAKKNGVSPVEHIVGYDALAVYVHKDNPIESITKDQLAAIYGENGDITHWSQIGVEMPEGADEIIRFSRQSNSGTFVYFRNTVLGKSGNFKLGSKDLHGSKDVVHTVGDTPGAIGYSGLAYATDAVKLVPVSFDGQDPVAPSIQSAVDGSYPIARPLFMYTAGEPEGAVKAYMDWIVSSEGQAIIEEMGYAPINNS